MALFAHVTKMGSNGSSVTNALSYDMKKIQTAKDVGKIGSNDSQNKLK